MLKTKDIGNLQSNEVFYRSLFGLPYASFETNAQTTLQQTLDISDTFLSAEISRITLSSLNISSWSEEQKNSAKIAISLTNIPGFPSESVRLFQVKVIEQLSRL